MLKGGTQMSDTPRTDAELSRLNPIGKYMDCSSFVPTAFARTLENELAIMTAQRDHYQKSNSTMSNKVLDRGSTIEKLQKELDDAKTALKDAIEILEMEFDYRPDGDAANHFADLKKVADQ